MPLPNVVGTTIVGTCQLVTAADQYDLSRLYPNSMGICRELFGISCVCTTIRCPLFIFFLIFAPGGHIFVKRRSNLTSSLMRGKRGSTCQSMCLGSSHNVISLLAVLVLRMLSSVFPLCRLATVSLHYVVVLCSPLLG